MRVGLTQRILYHKNRPYDAIEQSWYKFFQNKSIILIPNKLPIIIPDIDLLIITGGEDYELRNQVEKELVKYFHLKNTPIVGICHGCQLLTTMFGGKCKEVAGHMDSTHKIYVGTETQIVNSNHTQCIEYAPPDSKVLATDDEGNPEAWIIGNIAGIMWHPERMNIPWIPPEIQKILAK